MFYQTVHEKPIAKGLHSRRSERQRGYNVLYKQFEDGALENLGPKELRILEAMGFRYVILHSITDDTDRITRVIRLPADVR
jgi:hypothetical protein